MPVDLTLLTELTVIALTSGFLAGLLGIGGGIVMVPGLTWIFTSRQLPLDASVKMAIASSMAVIIFTAISSLRAHHRRGAVLWRVVKHLAPGIVLGSALASVGAFSLFKGSTLALCFALFMVVAATQMLLGRQPAASRQLPGPAGMWSTGSAIGFVSGLVGVGGGSMSVPFMTWCNIPIHKAVATSAALGLVIALANVAGYVLSGSHAMGLPAYAYGYIYLPALVVMAPASMLTAQLGAKLGHSLPTSKLKRMFALLLLCMAGYMLIKAFA